MTEHMPETTPDAARAPLERLGHTAITWPFTPDGAKDAMRDIAATGYRGLELFGFVLDAYPGGLDAAQADLDEAGLDLVAAYCSVSLFDAGREESDLDSMRRWARQVVQLGGRIVVVGPDQRRKPDYVPEDYVTASATLTRIGRLCAELGVAACFHPHTGTPVETRDEIARVMDGVDPEVVFMAPDTGQIAKGGGDPVEVTRTYSALIRHIHLKDYIGGVSTVDQEGGAADRTGYLDYLPLGEGVVDFPGILSALGPDYGGWIMGELDGTDRAPRPPREAVEISKRYLDGLSQSHGADLRAAR
jgi:inosose dehydratase